jgi:xanthine dehydrogenase accessory factor
VISEALSKRARELADQGVAFATATVVRAQRPTSVEAGDVALVLADGTIEGFVGGVCTEHSVRAYALQTLQTGEAVLLRVLPFGDDEGGEAVTDETEIAEGAVTVQNPCLSGGAIEVFLEPVLPAQRVLVVGETPIAAALLRVGGELGFSVVAVDGERLEPRPGDLAVVVAAHGRDELHTLRRGLEAQVPYVGLVASPRRGTGVLAELRGDGVPDELLARIDVPAGLDIGARSPGEIAVSILAKIVTVRHDHAADHIHPPLADVEAAAAPGTLAVDPICGMTVAAVSSTPSLVHEGETIYFCCEGCKAKFEAQSRHAQVGD